MLSFGFCPNYLQPPHSPQFGKLVQLFSDVEIQDLKVSLGLKILYMIYIQPKKQFIDQIIDILEEIYPP